MTSLAAVMSRPYFYLPASSTLTSPSLQKVTVPILNDVTCSISYVTAIYLSYSLQHTNLQKVTLPIQNDVTCSSSYITAIFLSYSLCRKWRYLYLQYQTSLAVSVMSRPYFCLPASSTLTSPSLQKVTVPVQKDTTCSNSYNTQFGDNRFCAGNIVTGGVDSCQVRPSSHLTIALTSS